MELAVEIIFFCFTYWFSAYFHKGTQFSVIFFLLEKAIFCKTYSHAAESVYRVLTASRLIFGNHCLLITPSTLYDRSWDHSRACIYGISFVWFCDSLMFNTDSHERFYIGIDWVFYIHRFVNHTAEMCCWIWGIEACLNGKCISMF